MATASPSYVTTTSNSSAWSRLVRLTKTASKNSRPTAVESLPQSGHYSPINPSTTPPMRPAKTRCSTDSPSGPAKTYPSSSSSTDSTFQQSPLEAGAMHEDETTSLLSLSDSIEVCPCLEGESPLPDGKCSLSHQNKHKSKSKPKSPPTKPLAHVDLRTLWAVRSKGKGVGKDKPRHSASSKDLGQARVEENEQHGDLSTSTLKSRRNSKHLTHVKDENSNRHVLQDANQDDVRLDQVRHQPVEGYEAASRRLVPSDNALLDLQATSPSRLRPTRLSKRLHDRSQSLVGEYAVTSTGLGSEREESDRDCNEPMQEMALTSGQETTQLATPSSTQDLTPQDGVGETETGTAIPVSKTKRRLTLHGSSYGSQQNSKKRKTLAKKQQIVQTTLSLSIGGSAGMRECKVCDMVYNPFHPEDVKVHTKRHAGALKKRASA